MHPPSVLVLGLGELGSAVVNSLAVHPDRGTTRLAVLKRSPLTKQTSVDGDGDIEALGVATLIGDVVNDSEDQLAEIFRPFHTVISCNGMTLPPEIQVKVARVALESGIKRYFPWQFGVDYDIIGPNSSQNLFTTQLEVRAMLRDQSRLSWVIVSTGMFTSFLFEPSFGLVNEERTVVTGIGGWENCITVTSPKDIGRLTAEIVLVHPEINGVVYTAGDTISMNRLADVVETTLSRNVQRRLKTVPELKEELAADPDNGMRKYRVVFAEGVGVSWDKASTFNSAMALPTETVDEWARQNLSRT